MPDGAAMEGELRPYQGLLRPALPHGELPGRVWQEPQRRCAKPADTTSARLPTKKSQLADRSAAASTVEQRPSARPTSDLWHICRRVGLIGSREPLGLQIGAHEPAGRYRTRASVACPLHHALDRRRRVHHACRASSGARAPRRSGGLGALRNHRKTLLGASAVVDPSRGRDRTLDGLAP